MKDLPILVVDDDLETREAVAAAPRGWGPGFRAAASSAEAMTAVQKNWPKVRPRDIAMPGEDGYTFIQKRALQRLRGGETPAFVLTALAAEGDAQRAPGGRLSDASDVHLSTSCASPKPCSALAQHQQVDSSRCHCCGLPNANEEGLPRHRRLHRHAVR